MRCHARCQCPRNSRSEVTGNISPAPDLADPCEEHRTSGKDPRPTRRTSPRQEAHSAAGKKDDLVTAPHPRSRSRCPPAAPDPGVFPSPCLNAMVMPLQTSDFFELTYPDLHHGLLGFYWVPRRRIEVSFETVMNKPESKSQPTWSDVKTKLADPDRVAVLGLPHDL